MTITAISKVKLLRTWTDDHLACAEISFNDQEGKARRIELWCIGAEGIGAITYAHDSATARADLVEIIRDQIEAEAE